MIVPHGFPVPANAVRTVSHEWGVENVSEMSNGWGTWNSPPLFTGSTDRATKKTRCSVPAEHHSATGNAKYKGEGHLLSTSFLWVMKCRPWKSRMCFVSHKIFNVFLFQCWEWNLGPHECWAIALDLSHILVPEFQILCVCVYVCVLRRASGKALIDMRKSKKAAFKMSQAEEIEGQRGRKKEKRRKENKERNRGRKRSRGERRGKRGGETEVVTHRRGLTFMGFILEDKNIW